MSDRKLDIAALRALEMNAAHDGWASSAWGAFRDALEASAPALLDAAEERYRLRDEVQLWIDRGAYYRNLAIEAGVKRDMLDNEDDARLVDLWEANQAERDALKAKVAELSKAIDAHSRAIAERDDLKAEVERLREALAEAERIRHKMDPNLSAKVGHPTCGKCGFVIPDPETCCRGTHGRIEARAKDGAK